MQPADQRRYPRHRVALSVVVDHRPDAPPRSVIDLSEGGAAIDWKLPDGAQVGDSIRLHFLLDAGQSLDLDGRLVHIDEGRAGVEFLPAQRDLIRQLLAEARSDD